MRQLRKRVAELLGRSHGERRRYRVAQGAALPALRPRVYVLILASASPPPAKESERIHGLLAKLFSRRGQAKVADEGISEAEG